MPPLSDQDREDLVAYLDGELPESAAKTLEAKLNLDAEARAEAVALRKTWELLDFLPRPEPSASFTHRTMERLSVQVSLARAGWLGSGRWPRWVLGVAWAAVVLLAAGVGFAGVHFLAKEHPGDNGPRQERPDPLASLGPKELKEKLVQDLRILENRRLYDNVDDLDFLRELDDPELFGDAGGQQ
jgi:hypothetical protein